MPALFYAVALAAVILSVSDSGISPDELTTARTALVVAVAAVAFFLLSVTLFELVCYFIFIPSISRDAHVFSRVHSTQLLHPLTTAILLGLAAMCLVTRNAQAFMFWLFLLTVYVVQTAVIVRRVRRENLMNGITGPGSSIFFLLLNLILGAEVVTVAAGARPLQPWRLNSLPEDTWIVDVRTKPEFHWNRLHGAENYPWGTGVVDAAKEKSADTPVLVTCLSGHRSPAVAVMLKKLGFRNVYNLNWGLIYLVLLERGRKTDGPFGLTRPHRDPARRGEDLRRISIGYITLQALILILAPLEYSIRSPEVSSIQKELGVILGLGGLFLGWLSFRGLGRNFRFYAAPRRSGTLITTGVYAKVRHPMYTAAVTMFAGYIILFGSLVSVPLWLAFAVLYLIKSVKEERILTAKFPEYEDYKKRTWRFIPFLV